MTTVTEGKPCLQFKPATEQITYKAFTSKFANPGPLSTTPEYPAGELLAPTTEPSTAEHRHHRHAPAPSREEVPVEPSTPTPESTAPPATGQPGSSTPSEGPAKAPSTTTPSSPAPSAPEVGGAPAGEEGRIWPEGR